MDLSIWKEGIPVTICEAVKLTCVDKIKLYSHINKLFNSYDSFGCNNLFLLVYFIGGDFIRFWNALLKCIQEFFADEYEEIHMIDNVINYGLLNSRVGLFEIGNSGGKRKFYLVSGKL